MKDFDKWVSDVIGKGMNFTPKEKDNIKENLTNTLSRWRLKGLIGKDELPGVGSEIIWEWKRDHDKTMIIKLVKTQNHYSNKICIVIYYPKNFYHQS